MGCDAIIYQNFCFHYGGGALVIESATSARKKFSTVDIGYMVKSDIVRQIGDMVNFLLVPFLNGYLVKMLIYVKKKGLPA